MTTATTCFPPHEHRARAAPVPDPGPGSGVLLVEVSRSGSRPSRRSSATSTRSASRLGSSRPAARRAARTWVASSVARRQASPSSATVIGRNQPVRPSRSGTRSIRRSACVRFARSAAAAGSRRTTASATARRVSAAVSRGSRRQQGVLDLPRGVVWQVVGAAGQVGRVQPGDPAVVEQGQGAGEPVPQVDSDRGAVGGGDRREPQRGADLVTCLRRGHPEVLVGVGDGRDRAYLQGRQRGLAPVDRPDQVDPVHRLQRARDRPGPGPRPRRSGR